MKKVLAIILAIVLVATGIFAGIKTSEVSQKDNEIASLRSAASVSEQSIASLEAAAAKTAAQMDTLNKTLTEKEDALTALNGEMETLKASIAEKETEIAGLKSDAEMLVASVTAKETEIVALEETKTADAAALDTLNAQVADLKNAITAKEAQIADLAAQVTAKEAEIADLTKQVTTKEALVADLTAQVASKDAEILALNEAAAAVVEEVAAEEAVAEEVPAEKETVTIFYTNDVHTYIDNVPNEEKGEKVAIRYSTVAALRKNTENAILVDAGDHAQGTAYGSMDKGEVISKLMSASGYDVATLGNHEFDYGMTGCQNIVKWAQFPYVSCNFYNEENGVVGDPVLAPYEVIEVGGVKVAFIGITTPETFTKSTPAYFQNEKGEYIFGIAGGTDGKALYEAVQKAIDAARLEADYVIALGHLGVDESSAPWRSTDVIENTCGLDAFIDGHSHTETESKEVMDKDGHAVLLTQTGEYFDAIGQMIITADGTITTKLLTHAELTDVVPDEEVKGLEDAWITEIDEMLGEVIGSVSYTFDNYDAEGNRLVRKQETNTGDFVADALVYLFENIGLDVDFAIMNGGGIRNKAITGELTYKSCKKIHTFGNVACLVTIKGQQILDALEWGAQALPDVEDGGFLHVSGLRYTVDASIPSTVQADDKGIWIGGPTGEYRVKDVQVFDQEKQEFVPLDPEAEYNIAGYNYTLRDLGDGFSMFRGADTVLDYVMEDYMVLANYIGSFDDGAVVGYEEPQNRITIILPEAEENEEPAPITVGGLDNNVWTTQYGNLYCDCEAETFIGDMGLNWGDIVTVTINGQMLDLPVVPTYSYVDAGEPAIIVGMTDETGAPTGYVSFAINMGNFTETYGIAAKQTDEAGNWWWTAMDGVAFPLEVTFELKEKDGYRAEYIMRELARTNERTDYTHLTDEQFANFRAVKTTGMGENKLYRSSSPINPELARNTYADAAMEAASVKTVMNLADNQEDAAGYEGFADTYYAKQNVIYLCLGVDFKAADFGEGVANGLRFISENEAPYMIHCTEGKDRAGFVNAILECLMGASYQEVVADYMTTYDNYYGIAEGTDKYNAIAESNIIASLKAAFGTDDLPKANLAEGARNYLLGIGMTDTEIDQLIEKLK